MLLRHVYMYYMMFCGILVCSCIYIFLFSFISMCFVWERILGAASSSPLSGLMLVLNPKLWLMLFRVAVSLIALY